MIRFSSGPSHNALIRQVEPGETSIPSESSIKVAKERRERVRRTKISGEEDYISLAVSRRDDNVHPESRLVREEDELGEVEEGSS